MPEGPGAHLRGVAAPAILLALLALARPGPVPRAAPEALEWAVASGLDKLRPTDPLPPGRAVDLVAAQGECESAQVAVRPRGVPVALAAEAAPLAPDERRRGRRIPVALYRVATVRLARPSGPDGAAGEWPDPLVPARDPWFREARRAFPVEVPTGRLQAIWVEVCVPADAAPGGYAGVVRLSDGGRRAAAVPVRLRVWPFAIPRTGTFAAPFGLSTRLGTRALGVPDDPEVARALAAAALRHRVTPYTLSADPPDGTCTAARCALDWTRYDAEVGPVLDGTLVPGVRGAFAEVRIAGRVWNGPEADLAATLRAWRTHFEARGWADRLWLYTLDEPRPDQVTELARRARLARAAGIRVFATTLPQPALDGLVDAYAPVLNALPDGRAPPRVAFSYASCMSHGCAELPGEGPLHAEMRRTFTGWPGYEVDRPGAAARAVAWLGWRRGLSGELYYDMLQAWRGDPWTDVRAFAGNGDGTLLYPGRPAMLGGTRPFPVESIRLKIVRDALEDVELLRLASAAGLGGLAATTAEALVPSARGWERDPARWLAARRRLGDALARRLAAR
ncbi:conserved hypothetical protein [Anaeromyxobacter dehalogenans 2CP-1]|uniref:Glycoside hydrolase 123-like N-terminal domain-containing protein n=1 Tax=Anaeromyxobacter dehalogenans (strain ATCC BAA-258 / DSM 21875 / 2CP-1) TaxID=455488 RepID=B8JH88_ANAD2|nr:conserved hypothetical protein [Anaeromyxobacter dehalogenans 2CP-1]